jgi:hypothetical protein
MVQILSGHSGIPEKAVGSDNTGVSWLRIFYRLKVGLPIKYMPDSAIEMSEFGNSLQ